MYNQEGKLEEWWTNTTSEGFNVRQKCIVDQFSSAYIIEMTCVLTFINAMADYTIDDGKGEQIHVNVSSFSNTTNLLS